MGVFLIALAVQATAPLQAGHWTVSAHRDAISDHAEVTARLRGDGGELTFYCVAGERSILALEPDTFLGGPISRYELRDTWIRLDNRTATRVSWKYTGRVATPYSDQEMFNLLADMTQASMLTIRATRFDNAPVDVVFDLTGSDEAIAEARRRC